MARMSSTIITSFSYHYNFTMQYALCMYNNMHSRQIFKNTVALYNGLFLFQIHYLRKVLIAITGIHSLWQVSKYSVAPTLLPLAGI